MHKSWRTTTADRTIYYDSTTTTSPLSFPKKSARHGIVIPTGTVASRVQYLQSLSNPSVANSPSIEGRRRETSRTAFGRRLTNQFGLPAQQSNNPAEESQVEASHSFTGLRTPRTKHIEGHSISDFRNRFGRSPGLNGDIKPHGLLERTQYDDVSPWGAFERSKSSRSMGRTYATPSLGVLPEIEPPEIQDHVSLQTPEAPAATTEDDARYRTKPDQESTAYSESSFVTTSTLRRQSVRDLFADYGIERPRGLASSQETSHELEPVQQPIHFHRLCHSCTWINGGATTKCWRCGHKYCPECNNTSPNPVTRKEGSLDYLEKLPKESRENSNPSPKPFKSRFQTPKLEPTGKTSKSPSQILRAIRPGPAPLQPNGPTRKKSSIIQFPAYVDPLLPKHGLESIPDVGEESPILVPLLSGTQVTKRVKDSPFLVADLLAPIQPIRLIPMALGVLAPDEHLVKERSCNSLTPSANLVGCESPGCRASHPGHHPFRHASTCHTSRRNQETTRVTDNGYLADTSVAEDNSTSGTCLRQSRPVSRAGCTTVKPPSQPLQAPKPASRLSMCTKTMSTHRKEVPEYVECHGYPRTSHSRHGSPTNYGIVGECQHCLDDCQCAACMNTHHSVRCCVHVDHQSIVHHHHTPKKSASTSIPESTPEPATDATNIPRAPTKKSRSATAVPKPPRKDSIHPASTSPRKRPSLKPEPLSKKGSLKNFPALPRSNAFKVKNQNSWEKPPTPPWVESPRIVNHSRHLSRVEPNLVRKTADAILSVEPVDDPPSPFQDRPTLPPSATCDQSSPEGTQGPALASTSIWTTQRPREGSVATLPNLPLKQKDRRPMAVISRASSKAYIAASTSASRRATRRLSALLSLKTLSPVPLLNRKLQDHQDEMRRVERASSAGISPGVVERRGSVIEQNGHSRNNSIPPKFDRPFSRDSNKSEKTRWRLKLVDTQPSPPCHNNGVRAGRQHRLEDDVRVEEYQDSTNDTPKSGSRKESRKSSNSLSLTMNAKVRNGNWIRVQPIDPEDHECVWKTKFLDEQVSLAKEGQGRVGGSSNVLGDAKILDVMVILHLEGKEDVVFKASGESRI